MRSQILMLLCAATAAGETGTPVVVELFTSEGCSSCPPADVLLSTIQKAAPAEGVEIIALSEHVDYWNQLGWSDPFSSRQFTERQQNYARRFGIRGPYTPQMVVDGRWEFVGSDRGRLWSVVKDAARNRKARVVLALQGGELTVTVPDDVRGEAWLAITEDGLATEVRRGENGGRTLRHDGVARRLVKLGRGNHFTHTLKPDAGWRAESLRAAVFVTGSDGAVLAAGAIRAGSRNPSQ